MATSMRRAGALSWLSKSLQNFTMKVDVQRHLWRVHAHPAWLRSCIHVTPVAFLHTGRISASQCSFPVTITEEQDTLLQKLTVLVKGHDKSVLDSYELFATLAAKELGLSLIQVFEPPRTIERLTLLKSVHIFKKHRVQYEMRTYYRCIETGMITGSTAHAYIEYIQRNLPEGVAMEITKRSSTEYSSFGSAHQFELLESNKGGWHHSGTLQRFDLKWL